MRKAEFRSLMEKRVLLLDGAMGTMIQRRGLEGNDLLCLTHPEEIAAIHKEYVEAGADIIETNTFNANRLSMADYGMSGRVGEIARKGAEIARKVADAAGRRVLVAGSVGPTGHTASMSPDVTDPALRDVDFDLLADVFDEQIGALIEGGVDLILLETCFDTINLKSAIEGARRAMRRLGKELPVMVSATVSDKSGRVLSGQTLEALVVSLSTFPEVVTLGLNCSFGPEEIESHVRRLAATAPFHISCHPNAGLPDIDGKYSATPELFAEAVRPLLEDGVVNIIGGCCGTTPDHIRKLKEMIPVAKVHHPALVAPGSHFSGLEPLSSSDGFVVVGERCNVAGSRKFLRLIGEKNYEEAIRIARKQVADGAMVVDVNLDDPLIDAPAEMTRFLNMLGAEPDVARVPVMIDSSNWEVIERGLKALQGKGIVNSISLKEGEEEFLRKAKRISELGGAMVVMAFDEKGQADMFERKIEVCGRSYRLLTEAGINPCDIIFDPNIMAIATGIEEHNYYARDFIRAAEWIKQNLPGAMVSGGVSNLSFAFRGNDPLRKAMHAVFLHHARKAGLDMAIVNPAARLKYEDIEEGLRQLLDDVILARRPEAFEELSVYAMSHLPEKGKASQGGKKEKPADRSLIPVDSRIEEAIIDGNGEFIEADIREKISEGATPAEIINGPLMGGMEEVGRRFGDGRMFLPQVVKTARTMKEAVELLRPLMKSDTEADAPRRGTVVIATVKGDVHDIGKNIVGIVLECNNFRVVDLGVMVEAERIVDAAVEEKADIVCLSGLITPSLGEMAAVARLMEERGLRVPLIVGGAATSPLHTALKLAPLVDFPVIHARDASQNPVIAARLLDPSESEEYVASVKEEYDRLSSGRDDKESGLMPIEEARKHPQPVSWNHEVIAPATPLGQEVTLEFKVSDIATLINWRYFFLAWRLTGKFVETFPWDLAEADVEEWKSSLPEEECAKANEALELYRRARRLLDKVKDKVVARGVVKFLPAWSEEDDIVVLTEPLAENSSESEWKLMRLPMLRSQKADSERYCPSLTDLVAPHDIVDIKEDATDFIGFFGVTATVPDHDCDGGECDCGDPILTQTIGDRFAEAAAECQHWLVRTQLWGYAQDEGFDAERLKREEYRGIRPAVGYPSLPDQLLNLEIAKILPLGQIGVTMTENGAMSPSSSICGLYIAHPAAKYFAIGKIGRDQLEDYSGRRGIPSDRLASMLGKYV